jgi:hypothetical protein
MPSIYQPILNQQGFTPDSKGMVDRLKGTGSMVETVADLGKSAIASGLEYSKIKQNQQISEVRGQVREALAFEIQKGYEGSPSTQIKKQEELGMYTEALDVMPSVDYGTAEEVNNTISIINSNIQNRMDYFVRAKEQGRLTPEAFDQNIRAVTKKFISDNPALRDEILEVAKNTLEDEGILQVIKRDQDSEEARAKREEDEYKFVTQEAKEKNIPLKDFKYPNGTLNMSALNREIDRRREVESLSQVFNQQITNNKAASEEEVRVLETSGIVPAVVETEFNRTSSIINQIYADNPTNIPKAKLEADAIISRAIADFKNNPLLAKYAGSQMVKDGQTDLINSLQLLGNAKGRFSSGEDAAKFTGNMRTIMSDQQNIALMRKLNVPLAQAMIQIMGLPGQANTTESLTFVKNMLMFANDIFKGNALDGSIFNLIPGTTQPAMSAIVQETLKGSDPSNPESVTNVSKVMEANINAINDTTISTTPKQQMDRADDFFKDVSKPEFIEKFIDIDPNTSNKYFDLLNKYNGQIDQQLEKYFIDNPNKTVKLEINPGTGMLIAQGADQAFNATFTSRINNALKAYANIRVSKPSEVYTDFYNDFFPGISQGKSYAQEAVSKNNPLNIKDSQGSLKEFNSLQASVEEFEKMIFGTTNNEDTILNNAAEEFRKNKRLFEEKKITQQVFRDRASATERTKKESLLALSSKPTSIRTIVDRFYKASNLPVSQEDKLRTVNYFSDIFSKAPNTPLDLDDKELIAKFYTGFGYLETGTTNIEPLRVASVLGRSYKTTKQKNDEKERMTAEEKARQEYSNFENQMEINFPNRSK